MPAAATVAGALFSNPKYPRAFPAGPTIDVVSETIPTTSLDFAADVYKLLPMRGSRRILNLKIENADLDSHGTPTLDMDVVLVDDDNVVATPVVLHDAGTGFQAARTGPTGHVDIPLNQEVVSKKNDAYIGLKVVTAAATAAAGNVTLWVTHEGTGG